MKKPDCTCCAKATEHGPDDEWYCRYHRKYIANIPVCGVMEKYQRPTCPTCGDFIDKGQECICAYCARTGTKWERGNESDT